MEGQGQGVAGQQRGDAAGGEGKFTLNRPK